ncbi:hypothetical protein [Acaryochloris sp. IP29b_bin.148]|uniref:hypothetical protein n=1 Tax=Acaryochloris sp. IP29b_bin.148 TaxID=2969218 RepID=UPI0026181108|nr:hypothetical protein [Acaryochloris sp. IP29b_bin.148]
MARYTRSLSVALSLSDCLTQLKAVLEGCNFEVLFSKEDCVIARETPGRVPFAKLVTIEVLVDSTRATGTVTTLDVVVKNEELPLQTNNHCSQMFGQLSDALSQHSGWQVVTAGVDETEQQTATAAPSVSPSESIVPPAVADQPAQPPAAKTTEPPQEVVSPENPPQSEGPSINLESMPSKQVQTTANLEELRQKRAESVANLERLRQKRAESIANLEKMRLKRERMFSADDRPDTSEDDFTSLDVPDQPSTSQA